MTHDELTLNILKTIEESPSQKSLSEDLKISVGKTNYVIKALISKGLIKAESFFANKNKNQYRYLLTQKGFKTKIELTEKFIQIKKQEYDKLVEDLEKYKKNKGKND